MKAVNEAKIIVKNYVNIFEQSNDLLIAEPQNYTRQLLIVSLLCNV